MLWIVDWWLVSDFFGQPIGPTFNSQDLLTLEQGTDMLGRNVGTEHSMLSNITSASRRKHEKTLIHFIIVSLPAALIRH